jgi:hypothetical protein
MLLYYPNKFDENEWTILIGILFNILIFIFLPKRIPKEITPLIVLLSISFPKIMDHSMGVEPYNFYDLTDSSKYEIFDLALYGVYPAFGYLFVYFLDYFNLKGLKVVLYIFVWNLFAVVAEFLLIKLHVFVYTGWKLIYSLPVYLVVLILTFLFYKFVSFYRNKNNQNQIN